MRRYAYNGLVNASSLFTRLFTLRSPDFSPTQIRPSSAPLARSRRPIPGFTMYDLSLKHRQLAFTHLHRPPYQPRLAMMVQRADHCASSRGELARLDRHAGRRFPGQDPRRQTESDGGGEVVCREVRVGGAGLRGRQQMRRSGLSLTRGVGQRKHIARRHLIECGDEDMDEGLRHLAFGVERESMIYAERGLVIESWCHIPTLTTGSSSMPTPGPNTRELMWSRSDDACGFICVTMIMPVVMGSCGGSVSARAMRWSCMVPT
jgi:hypothetical protein